jgi:septal ring factor EnvC (AmiA/AmiB activator)
MGDSILDGTKTTEQVGDALMRLRSQIEAAEATQPPLSDAIIRVRDQVRLAQVAAFRQQAKAKRSELEKHRRKVRKLMTALQRLEETESISLQNFRDPPTLTTRLLAECEWLERSADRLEGGGLKPLPFQPPRVVAPPG